MMQTVYLETTVIGNIAGRLHPDAIIAARQQITRRWWATAAVNGIDFLATWNFKHILNPETQHLIEAVCRDAGFEPSTICTPEQLLEAYDDS